MTKTRSGLQHIAIEVADIEKSIDFYRNLLGMKLTESHEAGEVPQIPVVLVFMRASDYHHDLVLVNNPNKTYRKKTPDDDLQGIPGVHHFAFEYPDREAWLAQMERVKDLESKLSAARSYTAHGTRAAKGPGARTNQSMSSIPTAIGSRCFATWRRSKMTAVLRMPTARKWSARSPMSGNGEASVQTGGFDGGVNRLGDRAASAKVEAASLKRPAFCNDLPSTIRTPESPYRMEAARP